MSSVSILYNPHQEKKDSACQHFLIINMLTLSHISKLRLMRKLFSSEWRQSIIFNGLHFSENMSIIITSLKVKLISICMCYLWRSILSQISFRYFKMIILKTRPPPATITTMCVSGAFYGLRPPLQWTTYWEYKYRSRLTPVRQKAS